MDYNNKADASKLDLLQYLQQRNKEQGTFTNDQYDTEKQYWNDVNKRQQFPKVQQLTKIQPNNIQNEPKFDEQTQNKVNDLKNKYGFDDNLAAGVLDSYMHPNASVEFRKKYYNEDMNNPEISDEEKQKIHNFYTSEYGNE